MQFSTLLLSSLAIVAVSAAPAPGNGYGGGGSGDGGDGGGGDGGGNGNGGGDPNGGGDGNGGGEGNGGGNGNGGGDGGGGGGGGSAVPPLCSASVQQVCCNTVIGQTAFSGLLDLPLLGDILQSLPLGCTLQNVLGSSCSTNPICCINEGVKNVCKVTNVNGDVITIPISTSISVPGLSIL